MTHSLPRVVPNAFRSLWIAGPIFDKELRVSSRRRRNYILRFAYLAILTACLALVWISMVRLPTPGLQMVSRMAEAGKAIIAFIIWFQFVGTQVVAAIMLSTSISDEIQGRTLGALMTTPISSFQIVLGKFLSKLLQLLLLLAISLPLLAIVRVFGGVPWGYVVSSLLITLTTVLLAGSVSIFFSIFNKQAYTVIIATILTFAVFFALVPLFAAFAHKSILGNWPDSDFMGIMLSPNPYVMMFANTINMLEPRAVGRVPGFIWPIHCTIILVVSMVVLLLAVIFVRRVALSQAVGGAHTSRRVRRGQRTAGPAMDEYQSSAVRLRRVKGPVVVWRELRTPLIGRRKLLSYIMIFLALVMLIISYGLFAREDLLDKRDTHISYAIVFLCLGALLGIVMPATSICSERESRSWPLLLSTTLTDWQIMGGKFIGVLKRSFVGWFLLIGHVTFFTLVGFIHPVGLLQTAILIAWLSVFAAGAGLYFSTVFRRTTTAVIANLLLAAFLWLLMPVLLGVVAAGTAELRQWLGLYIDTNPFVQMGCIMHGTSGAGSLKSYNWAGLSDRSAGAATLWMLCCFVTYGLVGLLLLWRAKCRIRRSVF